jgi:hypothetical protein
MVEVDVFWAYGIGASAAAAAGTPLARSGAPLDTPQFSRALLLLSVVWAPTGLLLLLLHPSWETMQVADSFGDIPAWLVLAFGITNVTQGVLGFWVGAWLLSKGRRYLAHLNWLAGYFAMFFVLLYGWDGLGYDRFLYDRDMFGGAPWRPGAGLQPGAGAAFLASTVARTLYVDGAYLLPPLLGMIGRWQADEARRTAQPGPRSAWTWAALHLAMVFGAALPTAAFSALCVGLLDRALGGDRSTTAHLLAYVAGLHASLAAAWTFAYAPGRPLHGVITRALRLDHEAPAGS